MVNHLLAVYHTIEQVEKIAVRLCGYHGHSYKRKATTYIDKDQRGTTTKSLWRWMKRRVAVEHSIGRNCKLCTGENEKNSAYPSHPFTIRKGRAVSVVREILIVEKPETAPDNKLRMEWELVKKQTVYRNRIQIEGKNNEPAKKRCS